MVTQSTRVSSHNSSHGSSILDRQGDLRTRTWWPHECFGREYGNLGHISACHSSSSSSSWTRPWGELVLPRNWKTDQWTKRSRWCKHYKNSKMPRGCRQAYCVKRLIRSSTPKPKPASSPTLCSAWEKWEMILLRPRRAKLNGIPKNSHFKDKNRIDGMPTEFEWKIFQGITALGLHEKIQKFNKRSTVWTWALPRQDHLHVNVQQHWMESKRKQRTMWIQFTESCELCS